MRREERGPPEQAALHSKVPLRWILALEADDHRPVPDAAYLVRPPTTSPLPTHAGVRNTLIDCRSFPGNTEAYLDCRENWMAGF